MVVLCLQQGYWHQREARRCLSPACQSHRRLFHRHGLRRFTLHHWPEMRLVVLMLGTGTCGASPPFCKRSQQVLTLGTGACGASPPFCRRSQQGGLAPARSAPLPVPGVKTTPPIISPARAPPSRSAPSASSASDPSAARRPASAPSPAASATRRSSLLEATTAPATRPRC